MCIQFGLSGLFWRHHDSHPSPPQARSSSTILAWNPSPHTRIIAAMARCDTSDRCCPSGEESAMASVQPTQRLTSCHSFGVNGVIKPGGPSLELNRSTGYLVSGCSPCTCRCQRSGSIRGVHNGDKRGSSVQVEFCGLWQLLLGLP